MYVLFDEHKTWKSNNSATESEEPGEFRVEFGTFGNQCLRDNDGECGNQNSHCRFPLN